MNCTNCLIEKNKYEIRFEGDHNQFIMGEIVNRLSRRDIEVEVQANIFMMKETEVKELVDFCKDHLETIGVSFRLNHQEWRPFSELEKILDQQWVDEVINQKLIVCHFQPIVDAKGEIFAYEILSRFQKEDGTAVSPKDIFSAAKSRGRLYALDRLCRMTAVRASAFIKNKKAFINFIPTSIYSPEFCLQSTIRVANQMGVDPSQLVFEVVETEQVDDIDHLKTILTYYKEKGFQYALDDVGEGFNTIELLQDITPQYMKLDIQYVQGVANDGKKQQTAKGFLQKALEVGSIPLAEGVELREDFEWLKQVGYQLFQGYLFGRPAPHPIEEQGI